MVGGDALPGDRFLLASDGLTRLVKDEELLAELSARNAEEAADRLIDMVLVRGAPDNVSLVIATVG
jgi:serine/threonine protein phosphatase PrpC